MCENKLSSEVVLVILKSKYFVKFVMQIFISSAATVELAYLRTTDVYLMGDQLSKYLISIHSFLGSK